MTKLTQERLKELLEYNPDTGEFIWLKSRLSSRIGEISGTLRPDGYRVMRLDSIQYRANRLAFLYMNGYHPEHVIDHINGIKGDNRWANLRHVTQGVNNKNTSKQANNSSGHTGIHITKGLGRFKARAKLNNKDVYLGTYDDIEDAIAARVAFNKDNGFTERHGL